MSSALFRDAGSFHVDAFGLRMVVVGTPQSGGSKRAFQHSRTGRVMVLDDNPNAAGWKEQVRLVARELMRSRPPFQGALGLSVVFYQPRPKWHMGKRGLRPMAPRYPIVKPDATKLLRPLEDALTGIVWDDDAQIVDQHVGKRYGEERADVRVRVIV